MYTYPFFKGRSRSILSLPLSDNMSAIMKYGGLSVSEGFFPDERTGLLPNSPLKYGDLGSPW